MKLFKTYSISGIHRRSWLIVLLSLSVLSCGGGAIVLSGITGTGIVVGTVTAFGSIWVNGVEYNIDTANFNLNGKAVTGIEGQKKLQVGMVVKLDATDHGDGTGLAASVIYDEAIEGPIADTPVTPASGDIHLKEMTVLGQKVIIDETGTSFFGTSFTTIKQNDIIEVSGYIDQNGGILATWVNYKGSYAASQGANVEMHGVIKSLDVIKPSTFLMNGVLIHYNGNTALQDMEMLQENYRVEVKGKYRQSDNSLLADIIEGEEDDLKNIETSTGEVSLQGLIHNLNVSANNQFELNDIIVDYSALDNQLAAKLADGLEVEVKGTMSAGVLQLAKLEVRSGDVKVKARVVAVDELNNTLTIKLGGNAATNNELVIKIDSKSLLEDERQGFDKTLTLSEIATDLQNLKSVQIDAELIQNDAQQLVVDKLKRKVLDDYEVQAVVSRVSQATSTLTLLGIDITMSPNAQYEQGDIPLTFDQFFKAIKVGVTRVKLKDKSADGSFDQAEIESTNK